jgi:membrane-associated phospholipid phosphatase
VATRVLHTDTRRTKQLSPVVAGALTGVGGYIVLAAAMVGLGAVLTNVLLPGSLQHWDLGVIHFLIRGRPDLNSWSVAGSYLAEFATVLVVVPLMLAFCLFKGWRRLAVYLAVSICLEGLVYVTTTYFVVRQRPPVHRLEDLIAADSFPSGHVAASVVMWVGFAVLAWTATSNRAVRAAAVTFAALAPVVVALSRMYRGMHYPTDATAGYLMGWGCVLVGYLVVRTAGVVAEQQRTGAST